MTTMDLRFDSGFMYCRLIGVDESSGAEVSVPGVWARIRCSRVNTYVQADEVAVLVYVDGYKDAFEVFTSIEAVDAIMRRANLIEIGAPQKTPDGPPLLPPPAPTTAPDAG